MPTPKLAQEAHAAVNPTDRWGETPLDEAVKQGDTPLVTYLWTHGANLGRPASGGKSLELIAGAMVFRSRLGEVTRTLPLAQTLILTLTLALTLSLALTPTPTPALALTLALALALTLTYLAAVLLKEEPARSVPGHLGRG